MLNFKFATDRNGCKIIKISAKGVRGFSIQTNQNLPNTHHNNQPDLAEIKTWVEKYGTPKQKQLIKNFI